MTVAQKVGLPPFFGMVVDHRSFLIVFLICCLITPGMMIILGLIGEFRLIPLTPDKQFLSFLPGDLFLNGGVAAAVMAAWSLPDRRGWWAIPIVPILVFCGTAAVAFLMTRGEWTSGGYPKWAILSPTKIYHNGGLYGIYGFLAAMLVIADVAGLGWREVFHGGWLSLSIIFFGVWAAIVVFEGMIFGKVGMAKKARHAHIASWYYGWLEAGHVVKRLVTDR